MSEKRIVITGIGIICANGIGVKEFWENTVRGNGGIKEATTIDTTALITRYAGEVNPFDPAAYFSPKQLRRMERSAQFAIIAAREAVKMSGLDFSGIDAYRAGLVLGTSLGGLLNGDVFHKQWIHRGLPKTHPSLLMSYPIHTPADWVSQELGLKGPRSVISTACAAGTNAIGFGADFIRSGKADIMVVGGVDPLAPLSFAGFNSLKALAEKPCAPYSKSEGITLGEGAGILILERLDMAQKRGATILAEVLAYELSADAYHPTAPDPGGAGAIRSMEGSIAQAGLEPGQISYVNGHGTGTPANDHSEPKAIKKVLGDQASRIPMSSTKSMTGHCLGAAGAVEGVACVLAIQEDILPPTINFQSDDPPLGLDYVPNEARPAVVDVALSNSFAFGGNNATIVLGKYRSERKLPITQAVSRPRVVITGLGTVSPGGVGKEELWETFAQGKDCLNAITEFDVTPYHSHCGGSMPDVAWKKYIPTSLLRRTDSLSKLAVAAARMALDDGNLKVRRANSEKIAMIFGTGTGPLQTVESINRDIITKGMNQVNPAVFPNSVMNAAAGQVCLSFSLKGPTSTITAGGVSASTALVYGYELLCQKRAEAVLVVGADEFNEPLLAGNDRLGVLARDIIRPFDRQAEGMLLSCGSTAFLLEREESARERGAAIYGELLGYGMTSDNYKIGGINPAGTEWAESIRQAVLHGGLAAGDIDFYAAAACGLPLVDGAEARAVASALGNGVMVSSMQSMLGYTSGGTGGMGLMAALLAIGQGVIPPSIHLENPIGESQLNYVVNQAMRKTVDHAAIGSYSFGGNYVTLLVGKYS
jgi:3-oxoacyl-[acyl-carrier-protein] synthase II